MTRRAGFVGDGVTTAPLAGQDRDRWAEPWRVHSPTEDANEPARRLYDRAGSHQGFMRYAFGL